MSALRETIDKMVEDAIRRILPGIMNEVLLTTLARSGALTEARRPERPAPVRRKPGPKPKRRPVREAQAPKRRPVKLDLSQILDQTAGTEFYDDPAILYGARPQPSQVRQVVQEEYEVDVEVEDEPPPPKKKGVKVPEHLKHLVEGSPGVVVDDGGEMWAADEHDSAPLPTAGEIRDPVKAAANAGIDFSRMKAAIGAAEKRAPRPDHDDVKAKAQFEMARIKRERERLNGGKPVE